jgi:hypothetical protein
VISILFSCINSNQDLTISNPKIAKALEKRQQEYKNDILTNCHREIYERAKNHVDSLIAAEINFQLSDSIVFPPKPVKPDWIGPIIISDTIRAKPIF